MKARALLMIEHRLIEEMLEVIKSKSRHIVETGFVSPGMVETIIDFFETYADRTHHGKEDILFNKLSEKELDQRDEQLRQGLIDEHKRAREIVKNLSKANEAYKDGGSVNDIVDIFDSILELYSYHIDKEDRDFFPASEKYFSSEELDTILEEFQDFDRKMIHEKYKSLVDNLK